MSEAPSPRETTPDADAWSTACAEDIAEQASKRRIRQAYQPGSAADELRRLADAVVDKVAELRSPIAGLPAQALISQAKSVLGQARDRNPDLFDHLAAAGSELLAAYRSAVSTHERRWANDRPAPTEHIRLDRTGADPDDGEGAGGSADGRPGDGGSADGGGGTGTGRD